MIFIYIWFVDENERHFRKTHLPTYLTMNYIVKMPMHKKFQIVIIII